MMMCTWFDRLTHIAFLREGSNSCFFIDCHTVSRAVAITFTFLFFSFHSTAYRKFQKNKTYPFLTGCTFIVNCYCPASFLIIIIHYEIFFFLVYFSVFCIRLNCDITCHKWLNSLTIYLWKQDNGNYKWTEQWHC